MSLRFNAINNLSTSQEANVEGSAKITAIFNENVFPGNRCCYRGGKNRAIVFISLRVQPDGAFF